MNFPSVIKERTIRAELKRVMESFYSVYDSMDCGLTLALNMSGTLANLRSEGQRLQKELIELDPSCPKKLWLEDIK